MWASRRPTVSMETRREIFDTENAINLTRPVGQLLLWRIMQEVKKQNGYLEVCREKYEEYDTFRLEKKDDIIKYNRNLNHSQH